MSVDSIKLKIHVLVNSEAKNYLESQERLFLSSFLKDLETNDKIKEKEIQYFQGIYDKYKKYIS